MRTCAVCARPRCGPCIYTYIYICVYSACLAPFTVFGPHRAGAPSPADRDHRRRHPGAAETQSGPGACGFQGGTETSGRTVVRTRPIPFGGKARLINAFMFIILLHSSSCSAMQICLNSRRRSHRQHPLSGRPGQRAPAVPLLAMEGTQAAFFVIIEKCYSIAAR
jgi:hypothetical protein